MFEAVNNSYLYILKLQYNIIGHDGKGNSSLIIVYWTDEKPRIVLNAYVDDCRKKIN